VRLTEAGREVRTGFASELLISDGMVEEFGGRGETAGGAKKRKAAAGKTAARAGLAGAAQGGAGTAENAVAGVPVQARLTAEGEAVAARIREWRAAEAKRLKVPAYVVMHDRTVTALAGIRPRNPKELLAILGLCSDGRG
jgi:superfamily II DNA helicase RecQ